MVCAQKGYPLVVVMAENFSIERRRLMRFLGAKVVLTPASDMGSGMVAKAAELAEKHGWWLSRQFENPANADMHARTTGQEIVDDFADIGLDYFVSGFGTGGTLKGVARGLKADGELPALHPNFRPHLMQGWSPNFIPRLLDPVTDEHRIHGFLAINGNDAMQTAMDLARKEGIFVGTSSGATFAGALKVAETAPEGSNILCMLPDTGERYLSTPLFDPIIEDMDASELSISQSTPNYRFDVSAPEAEDDTPDNEPAAPVELDPAAIAEVDQTLRDNQGKIVMFALEWCEFCWSVRKMMDACDIPYTAIPLDSVAYQENNRGGKILDVLVQRNDWPTIPQIYVGDEFVGGATDLFDIGKDGDLEKKLDAQGIPYNAMIKQDPYNFLPTWLHPR